MACALSLKATNEALRQSEERLKRSQEIAHLGSWELDIVNNHLSWSDEVYRIFGLRPQEFKATYEAFLERVHPDDRKAVDDAYAGSLSEGRDAYEIEHRVVRKATGEIRYVHEKCEHIRDESGRIIRSVGMVHDITERKRVEETLKETYDTLEVKIEKRTEELAEVNRQLTKEVLERKEIEKQIRVRGAVLKVMGRASNRKEYLDILIRYIKGLARCRYCGIRVLNEEGEIPYESYVGFSREFWEKENWLSVNQDQCACIRVVRGRPLAQDIPCMSKGGSFVSNDSLEFVNNLSEKEKKLFRGQCMQCGFKSLAVVPIQYKSEIIGAIHLADERQGVFPQPKLELIELLTPLIGEGIHKFDIEDRVKQSYIAQSLISALMRFSFEEASIEKILNRCLELLFSINWLSAESKAGIFLMEKESNTLVLKAQKNLPEYIKKSCAKLRPGVYLCGKAAKEKSVQFAGEFDQRHEITYAGITPHSHYCVPILLGEELLGVMNLYLAQKHRQDTRKEEFLIAVSNTLASIIQRRQSDEKLKEAQMQLVDARRLSDIGTLAATVAHELRNPLAAIQMASYNIKRKAQNPLLDKHLLTIENKVNESEQIISNLLFYSRLRLPQYEDIKIYKTINECIGLIKRRFAKEKISLDLDLRVIKKVSMEADPLQIKEVFCNILNNAYEAQTKDDKRVEIKAEIEDEVVKFMFKDSGEGINKHDLERIFDPFFTTKAKGTGLGLTVCKQVINLHGGMINIESEKDKGTVVSIRLPIKRGIQ